METRLATDERQRATTLAEFLKEWDELIELDHSRIPLFDPEQTKNFTRQQQACFAETFCHARGHFHEVLWSLGVRAPDRKYKQVILDNIADEFGGDGPSHEHLYRRFADYVGADLTKQETYLPFLQVYNRDLLGYLCNRDWDEAVGAFCAYERLDNAEYRDLERLAKSFGVNDEKVLMFFKVHRYVTHYDDGSRGLGLQDLWDRNPGAVRSSFGFIRELQRVMWQNLSDTVFGSKGA